MTRRRPADDIHGDTHAVHRTVNRRRPRNPAGRELAANEDNLANTFVQRRAAVDASIHTGATNTHSRAECSRELYRQARSAADLSNSVGGDLFEKAEPSFTGGVHARIVARY